MESITKIVVLDDGSKVEFPRLWLEDLFSASEELVADREAIARSLAKEEDFDKFEVYNIVLDIRSKKPTIHEMVAMTNVPQAASLFLRKSLTKAGVAKEKATEIIKSIAITDCIDIARLLILDIQEQKKETPGPNAVVVEATPPQVSDASPSTSKNTKQEELLSKAVGYGGPLPTAA